MRFLITAGPTREPIDDVRFLSNRSTGKMGYGVAEEARVRGHEVTLVSGPVALTPPKGVSRVPVETALQMHEAVLEHLAGADVLVMSAAVADYRPAPRAEGKVKKSEGDWTLTLVRNPDILAEAGESKGKRIHVGFAVESEDLLANAGRKLAAKNLDLIVANAVSAFGADRSTAHFLTPQGSPRTLADRPKREIASEIVAFCEGLFRTRRG